jgi:hypothetical protein
MPKRKKILFAPAKGKIKKTNIILQLRAVRGRRGTRATAGIDAAMRKTYFTDVPIIGQTRRKLCLNRWKIF